MKQPQYNKGDKVMFLFDGFDYALLGIIETVDANGTFFQKEQPYYDIISPEHGNALFKHVPEENIKSAEFNKEERNIIRKRAFAERRCDVKMRNLIRYYKALLSCKAELTEFAGYGEYEEEIKELLAHVVREEKRVADLLDKKVKTATLCTYSWSEDGEIEHCTQTEDVAKEDTVCDYCDNNIKAGEKAVFLVSIDESSKYVLHPECAKKGCTMSCF